MDRQALASAESGSRREILDAAARLLRRRGYSATTLRDVAAEVGIKAASIYHHFGSKDEIVAAVLDRGIEVVHAAVAEALDALAGAPPRLRLEAAIRAHLLALLAHSDYTSASIKVFSTVPARLRERHGQVRRRYEELWRGLVAELDDDGLVRPGVSRDGLRLMLLGAMNWTVEWYRPGRLSIEALAADFATLAAGPKPGA